jgi:hypothetical protein
MTEDRERRIRERAHEIWEQEGRPEGRQEEHWRQASQEIGDELFRQQGATDAQERPGALDGGLRRRTAWSRPAVRRGRAWVVSA